MKRLITAILTAAMVMAPAVSYAGRQPEGYLYNDYGCVTLSKDGTDNTILQHISDIAPGETVYYSVSAEDGYFCRSLKINAVSAGENAFIMPEGELAVEPKYGVRGDANHDGKLNLSDVGMILRAITDYGWKYWSIDRNGADFNRDGKVNLSDASVIMRKIAAFDEGGRIRNDSGYIVTNLADVTVTGYMLTETNVPTDPWSKGDADLAQELNREPITSTDELREFTKELMTSLTEIKSVTDDGSLEPSDMTPASFMAEYTDEFFEVYDIVPVVVASNRPLVIDRVWYYPGDTYKYEFCSTAGESVTEPVIFSREEPEYFGECFLYFMTVPKGEYGYWYFDFSDGRPEFFEGDMFLV